MPRNHEPGSVSDGGRSALRKGSKNGRNIKTQHFKPRQNTVFEEQMRFGRCLYFRTLPFLKELWPDGVREQPMTTSHPLPEDFATKYSQGKAHDNLGRGPFTALTPTQIEENAKQLPIAPCKIPGADNSPGILPRVSQEKKSGAPGRALGPSSPRAVTSRPSATEPNGRVSVALHTYSRKIIALPTHTDALTHCITH